MRDEAQTERSRIEESQYMEQITREPEKTVIPMWQSTYEAEEKRVTSISDMARRLRNAFIATLALFVAITLIPLDGRITLGIDIETPVRPEILALILATVAVAYGGVFLFSAAWRALKKRTANTTMLVSLAIIIAYTYSVVFTLFVPGTTLYGVVTLIIALTLLDYWVETLAWGRATEPVRRLIDLRPTMAHMITSRGIVTVPVERVTEGEILVVRPGENVPVDGVITEGEAAVDMSEIVGESPVIKKGVGDEVIGATRNLDGTFKMRVTRIGDKTLLSKIIGLVGEAQRSRTERQKSINKVVSYFVPGVILAAALASSVWGIAAGQGLEFALLVAVATLIVASPDSLVLAAPIVNMVATGYAVRRGILIKDAKILESASDIDMVIFEKSQGLTEGRPHITDVFHVGKLTEAGFLRLAAGLGKASNYEFSRALMNEAEKQVGIAIPHPQEYTTIEGYGVIGEIETRTILLGNKRLMLDKSIDLEPVEDRAIELSRQGRTIVYVAVDGRIEGILGAVDDIRPDAKKAVKDLHGVGISVGMMTNDNFETAVTIADELNIDKVYADVLPESKVDIIKELQTQGMRVAMVGNRKKDADAIGQADIGAAIIADENIEFDGAEVLLLSRCPFDVIDVIALGMVSESKTNQNVMGAIIYNAATIPIAMGLLFSALGIFLGPEIAVILMSASTIAVIANSLQLEAVIDSMRT